MEISTKGYKRRARKILRRLGENSDPYHSLLDEIKYWIRGGRISPVDVGTSEAELEKFRVENHKSLAAIYLEKIRAGESRDLFVIYFRDEVRKGGFSLADIGTSREELIVFCPWIPGNLTLS